MKLKDTTPYEADTRKQIVSNISKKIGEFFESLAKNRVEISAEYSKHLINNICEKISTPSNIEDPFKGEFQRLQAFIKDSIEKFSRS